MATRKKPANRYHHGALRAALLEAAGRVVEKHGPDALSLRAVADALGVSHAAPGYHFASKEALLEALRAEAWRSFSDLLEASDTLDAAGRAYVRFATQSPRQLELMFRRHAPSAEVGPQARRAWAALVAHVAKAVGPKRAADERELNAVTLAVWAQVHGLATLLVEGPMPDDFPARALEERVHEIFARAVLR